MSSSFIQIKPIGSHQMGMLSWHNPLTLTSQDFPQARRRVSCNLFGRPEKGAINETYRQEEKKRIEQFKQRYICFDSEEPPKQQPSLALAATPTKPTTTTTRPTIALKITTTTTANIAESRLSSSGESLIEKELREHEMKLKQQQQRKKTANCNEKLVVAAASDRIKSRNLKLEELTAAAAARTLFVDSSKCASSHGERPKPYARQQSSITDYYPQRKTVVCNNSRTAAPEINQSVEEGTEMLPHLLDETVQFGSTTATTTTSSVVSNNESSSTSSSSSTTPHQCEQEPSQEQISLHTMTTDVSVELA